MAETSHRDNPDWKDLADAVPPDSFDPESRSPAAPEDLPGSRSEMLPREESDALARMADADPASRAVKPDETSVFGFPHPSPAAAEPTLFDDSRSSRTDRSARKEETSPVPEAPKPKPDPWDEDEASLQERLRKWMADARMRQQTADPQEPPEKEPSPSLQRLREAQRTMIMGSAGSDPTLAETPEAHAKTEAARLLAAQPPVPVDPMATIMVPADQFLGAKSPALSDLASNPPRKAIARPPDAAKPMTREEALTRKVALLRRNAEGAEDGPAWIPPPPSEDKTLIAAAVALLAVIFVLALGLFAATYAGMFDGLESRFEFLRPDVSAQGASPGTASAGTVPDPAPASGSQAAPSGMGDRALTAYLQSAAKADASNLLTLYGRYARRFPGLTGEVRMQLTIGAQGRILAGSVTSSTTGVAEFDKAVLLRVMAWRLPASPPGSAPKIATFPLLFPLRGL